MLIARVSILVQVYPQKKEKWPEIAPKIGIQGATYLQIDLSGHTLFSYLDDDQHASLGFHFVHPFIENLPQIILD